MTESQAWELLTLLGVEGTDAAFATQDAYRAGNHRSVAGDWRPMVHYVTTSAGGYYTVTVSSKRGQS